MAGADTAPVPAVRASAAVAVPDSRPYRDRYLDEVAPASVVGRMIKFNGKDGKFITTDDDPEVAEAVEFIALCAETLVGWVKFNGVGEPPDRMMGLLYDGFVMPPKESLPDRDESQWEEGPGWQARRPVAAPSVPRAAGHRVAGTVHLCDVEPDGATCGWHSPAPLQSHAEDQPR